MTEGLPDEPIRPIGRVRRTLLLVDDEDRILSALRRCLRREGYEILTADSVDRALELVGDRRIDLVLSDHKMGWSQAISEDDLAAAGVFSVIPKPWDDTELKDSLRTALLTATGGSQP